MFFLNISDFLTGRVKMLVTLPTRWKKTELILNRSLPCHFYCITCNQFHVFPRLPLVTCFHAVAIGYVLLLAWRRFRVFPRLQPVSCCNQLCLFPPLSPISSFQLVACFPRLLLVSCFSALAIGLCFAAPRLPLILYVCFKF